MKFIYSLFLGFIMFFSLSAEERILEISKIDQVMLENISPEDTIIVHFTQGDRLPLEFFLDGDLLNLTKNDSNIVIEAQTSFYLKGDKENFLFSVDGSDWKDFWTFSTGDFNCGLQMKDNQLVLSIGGDWYKRT